MQFAGLLGLELVCIWLFITAVLSESEATASKAICAVHDHSPVEESCDAHCPSRRAHLIMLRFRCMTCPSVSLSKFLLIFLLGFNVVSSVVSH